MLRDIRNNSLAGCVLRLFKNDVFPAEGNVSSDLVEANFTGYAAIQLALADWAAVYYDAAAGQARTDLVQKTFTQTGTTVVCPVYGWYLTLSGTGLVCAERDPAAPYQMNATGRSYSVIVNYILDNFVGP